LPKILITGGNGFIGSQLGESLVKAGNDVSLFDLVFNWHTSNLQVPKIQGDINDYEALSLAADGTDIVVHLAAVSRVEDAEVNPELCNRVNVEGTANVAKVAAEKGALLMFSSSREVYGNSGQYPVSEGHEKSPSSVYGRSKLVGETILLECCATHGLRYVIFRCSNVFGSPRDRPQRVVPKFVAQAKSGENMTVQGGTQFLDLTFVDDVVAILTSLIRHSKGLASEDYNVVTGRPTTVLQLAELVKELTHSNSAIEIQDRRNYGASEFLGDPSKLRLLLGKEFRLRGLPEGLPIYIDRQTAVGKPG
jgi:nucleoside-diphosphate-sugar epimerase